MPLTHNLQRYMFATKFLEKLPREKIGSGSLVDSLLYRDTINSAVISWPETVYTQETIMLINCWGCLIAKTRKLLFSTGDYKKNPWNQVKWKLCNIFLCLCVGQCRDKRCVCRFFWLNPCCLLDSKLLFVKMCFILLSSNFSNIFPNNFRRFIG